MRILLDTNIWRYVVDHDALGAVQQAARKSRHEIVIAPAVVYEALRTGRSRLRDSLVSAMTLPCWKRLMPEAFSEAEEIKTEVKRLQSDWLRLREDLTWYRRLQYDWTRSRGGFWDRARYDTARESQRADSSQSLDAARAEAREFREDALSMPGHWRGVPLGAVFVSLAHPMSGWDGNPVELWRVKAHSHFERVLDNPEHPYAEWLEGEVNLTMMKLHPRELTRFWLHDVDPMRMPRHWLRSAFEFLQQFHKITDGTPADGQIGTYLVDVDLMLSADKNFVRFAERCRCDAPFFVGRSALVPGGRSAIDVLLAELAKPA
ncbi:type II toxin-antitoxin system VapC family toxin [Paraburkholderia caledonica]|uniref:type II toxin-antitoxin system VapC family toxin n=1 Tax=Paraburkholderia caledonica TaxID=134536 RepID=UPI0038B810AA